MSNMIPDLLPPSLHNLTSGAMIDPEVIQREFPQVVNATMFQLQYVLEKFGRESDERCRELVGRVVNCIAGECGWLLNFVCSCCLECT